MAYYRGYNTVDSIFESTRLTESQLVRRDILNHFNVNQGEAVMRPNFGSIIKSIVFEPLTPETQELILEEIKRVVQSDPRVQMADMELQEFENGIQVAMTLDYLNTDLSEQLFIKFDRDTQSAVFV
jgi:phage baseplate assembly protein W